MSLLNSLRDLVKENELLRRNLVIYIFNNFAIKKEIFFINYNNINIKYFTRKRIKKDIRFKYY